MAARHACGAVKPKHLQAYLDVFDFRFNGRKTNAVGRIACSGRGPNDVTSMRLLAVD
jgi:hypothetical protein